MIRAVRAECPSCKHALQIPSDWVGQVMRCKHCRQSFFSRQKLAPIFAPHATFAAGTNGKDEGSELPAFRLQDEQPQSPPPTLSPRGRGQNEGLEPAIAVAPVVAATAPPAAQPVPASQAITAQPPQPMPLNQPTATPIAPVSPYGYGPYGFQPYNPNFDFDGSHEPAPAAPLQQAGQPGVAVPAADPATPPAAGSKPKVANHWWKPAALGGVAFFIMVGILIASGGNLAGLFTPKKKGADVGTLQAKSTTPDESPPKTKTPTPKKNVDNASGKTSSPPPKAKSDTPAVEFPKIDLPKKGGTLEPKNEPKTTPKNMPDPSPEAGPDPNALFPRRALLISVNNYLFANSLHYGYPRQPPDPYPGSSINVLDYQLQLRPFKIPGTQITRLSDGVYSPEAVPPPDPTKPNIQYGMKPHSTLKSVLETTIVDFVINSRVQDRIILFFAGHAIDIDNESYLVPLEGDLENAKSLIPLSWVYDQLAKCKARQKLLILDVCRFPPARGLELPTGGPMGEVLDTKLQNPPTGVQVWSACTKDQLSYEFEKGSLFLQALCACLQERVAGIQKQSDNLPVEELVVRVNQYMKRQLDPQKLVQTSRLTGMAPADGAPFDPSVPLPDKIVLRRPLLPSGGAVAGAALVGGILDEIKTIPPVRAINRSAQKTMLEEEYLPPFPAAAVDPFKTDMTLGAVQKAVSADPTRFPLRAAVLNAVKALNDNANFVMKETLTNPGGPISPKIKEGFLKSQEDPGIALFELERALKMLEDAGQERDKEPSKRWQAHYDYTLARLLARTVYTYEYNFMLAQVRSDSLPPLEPAVHNGWRIGSREKPQIREDKVRNYTRTIRSLWTKIREEYPNTPWEILARRESLIALGLEWRPSRD